MVKTIENNSVVLIDPDEEPKVVAALMENINAFISVRTMEIVTTLDKATQYRERKEGRFPKLYALTRQGKRKAYRIDDLKEYLKDPQNYSS